jgi:hypothetical protein
MAVDSNSLRMVVILGIVFLSILVRVSRAYRVFKASKEFREKLAQQGLPEQQAKQVLRERRAQRDHKANRG